jgi:hypothetical protein
MPFEAEHALSRTKGTPEMKKQKKESKHQSSGPGAVEGRHGWQTPTSRIAI